MRPKGQKVLPGVQPNVGVELMYRRKMRRLIEAMHASVEYWVRAAYRANEPEIAQDGLNLTPGGQGPSAGGLGQPASVTGSLAPDFAADISLGMDASPAMELKRAIKRLTRYWNRRFAEASDELADFFAKDVSKRSDKALMSILRKGGFSVRFRPTRAMNDIMQATVQQNVALIKSIPAQYLGQVEGSVMRSVQVGRDLDGLVKELRKNFGVTYRRAALIARDQNSKATSALTRARQMEIGLTEAVWLHSHAGKKPRPTHVKMDGKRYPLAKGMYDPAEGKYVHPGELINCRCIAKPIVKGFS